METLKMSPSQIRIDTQKREELLSSTQKTQQQQDHLHFPIKYAVLQDQPQDPQTKAPRLMARGLWIRVFVVVVRCVSRGSLLSLWKLKHFWGRLQSIDTDTRDIKKCCIANQDDVIVYVAKTSLFYLFMKENLSLGASYVREVGLCETLWRDV